MNNAIEVNKLCKDYGDFSLNNISFSLPTGYIMGFVGQNGYEVEKAVKGFYAEPKYYLADRNMCKSYYP